MAGVGGYQAPANPAPVSGPGALSQRTDGGPADKQPIRRLPDAQYGENKAFVAQQQGAPVPASETPQPSMSPKQARAAALAAPENDFFGPSVMPSTPVTDGAARGPGRGPEAIFQTSAGTVQATLEQLAPLDQSGAVQALLAAARAQGA